MTRIDLASWIENHIGDLTSSWLEAVRAEPRIQSDSDLSESVLRDHIPAVIEEICELLHSGELPNLLNTREARVHAYVRYRQGYRARELVRELSLLRLTLLDHVSSGLFNGAIIINTEDYIDTTRLINLYIDEEMSYAVSVYAESPDAPHSNGSDADHNQPSQP